MPGISEEHIAQVKGLVRELPRPTFFGLVLTSLGAHRRSDPTFNHPVRELETDLRYCDGSLDQVVGDLARWLEQNGVTTELTRSWPEGNGFAELGAAETDPQAAHNGVTIIHDRLIGAEGNQGLLGRLQEVLTNYEGQDVADVLAALTHVHKAAEGAYRGEKNFRNYPGWKRRQPPPPRRQLQRPPIRHPPEGEGSLTLCQASRAPLIQVSKTGPAKALGTSRASTQRVIEPVYACQIVGVPDLVHLHGSSCCRPRPRFVPT
ncbi:MAG: hypothetical protein DLM55_11625 [Acidimicrobiales bacterium]|nr:MAG: hypothetical protein DLM55_11625 [Acidimicrobiales bacterium]